MPAAAVARRVTVVPEARSSSATPVLALALPALDVQCLDRSPLGVEERVEAHAVEIVARGWQT